jgi:hypothetical protein
MKELIILAFKRELVDAINRFKSTKKDKPSSIVLEGAHIWHLVSTLSNRFHSKQPAGGRKAMYKALRELVTQSNLKSNKTGVVYKEVGFGKFAAYYDDSLVEELMTSVDVAVELSRTSEPQLTSIRAFLTEVLTKTVSKFFSKDVA